MLQPGQVTDIQITKLQPDPDQPRKTFDDAGLEALAASLKVNVQVPLLVRAGKGGKYIIHDGERRYRAARLAKLKTLPVLLVNSDPSEQDIRFAQLAVNNLREQLKPMEVARVLADMRQKHFSTVNDMAAFLDANGLPAMDKKQITDAIALVELPDWAQDMVDAGVVEISAIKKLKIALLYSEVLSKVKNHLERIVGWRGGITNSEFDNALRGAFHDVGVDLDRTHLYSYNPIHFNPDKVCKGCEHLVRIKHGLYCMDPAAFEKKEAEAVAAGLGPGGRKPEKSERAGQTQETDEEEKARRRSETLGDKAREYLHTYLVNRIVRHMLSDAEKSQIDITRELLAWHAMDRPGEWSYQPDAAVEQYQAASNVGIKSLEDLFAAKDLKNPMLYAATEVASRLKWRETQVICHQVWGKAIRLVWKMDEAFLKLFRKAELLHLVEQHGLADAYGGIDGWGKLKVSEIKAALLDRADKVESPKILDDIYQDVAKPREPYTHLGHHHYDDDEDDE